VSKRYDRVMCELNACDLAQDAMSVVQLNGEPYAVVNLNGRY
jgi:hypothetical protein